MVLLGICKTRLALVVLLISLFFPFPAHCAEEWGEFYNNLATDITPLLALFGEQVTKQFLSESITIWDNVIFALLPLGIITAIVSVVRVCGNSTLKALIGRSQEGHGVAEAELCSSTSFDVCELWSNGGVARIFGQPKIVEFIHDEGRDPNCFYSPGGNSTAGLYRVKDYIQNDEISTVTDRLIISNNFAPSPNLSLNIGIKRTNSIVVFLALVIGGALQVGVVMFAAWMTYISIIPLGENETVPAWAFPLFVTGTFLLCVGMFLCAYLIEKTTTETFIKLDNKRTFWLQPHNQMLGDQTFNAFAYSTVLQEYATSWKVDHTSNGKGNRVKLVLIATAATILGFILQFVGLRSLHPFVAIFQLAATLVMAVVRIGLRARRLGDGANALGEMPDPNLQGHELDWQALNIESSNGEQVEWEVSGYMHFPSETDTDRPQYHKGFLQEVGFFGVLPDSDKSLGRAYFEQGDADLQKSRIGALRYIKDLQSEDLQISKDCEKVSYSTYTKPNFGARILYYRARLARLTDDEAPSASQKWDSAVRECANQLKSAIEGTTREVMSGGMQLKESWRDAHVLFWGMNCSVERRSGPTRISDSLPKRETYPFYLVLNQEKGLWEANKSELEAILGLWTWSLRNSDTLTAGNIPRVFALCESDNDFLKSTADLQMWVSQSLSPLKQSLCKNGKCASQKSLSVNDACLSVPFANNADSTNFICDCGVSFLAVPTRHDILRACALDIYKLFLCNIFGIVSGLSDSGPTLNHNEDLFYSELQRRLRFSNRHIDNIAKSFVEVGLGTQEDALLCIIPVLRSSPGMILPLPPDIKTTALTVASQLRRNDNYVEAEALIRWLYFNTDMDIVAEKIEATREMGELYRRALRSHKDGVQEFGFRGIIWMLETSTPSVLTVAREYGWVALKVAEDQEKWYYIREILAQHVDEATVPGFENMTLSNAMACNSVYPISLLIAEHWKPPPGTMVYVDINCNSGVNKWLQASPLDDISHVDDGPDSCRITNNVAKLLLPLLSVASGRNYLELLEDLLEMGFDYNQRDGYGRTPIFYGAMNGHVKVVSHLLAAGASAIVADKDGRFPLGMASEGGHTAVVELLLTKSSDIDIKDRKGRTALFYAAASGSIDTVQLLLAKGASINGLVNRDSPLHAAARGGHEGVLRILIEKGADLNAKDSSGMTPLHVAFNESHWGVTKILIEEGADFNTNKLANSILHKAIGDNEEEAFKVLVEKGVDLNSRDKSRKSPVHVAVEHGREEMLQTLLSKGADASSRNMDGSMPIHFASKNGLLGMLQLLVDKNSTLLNAENYSGRTPLHVAVENGHEEALRFLIDKGADVNAQDYLRRTPLLAAVESGYENLVQILIENGADIDTGNGQGVAPLHAAAREGSEEMLQILIDKGADINIKDSEGKAPLHYGAAYGHDKVLQFLIAKGASRDAKDNIGRTPSQIAAELGHESAVQILARIGA